MPRRVFTVADVDELIPRLEEVIARIGHHMDALRPLADRLQILDLLWGARVHDEGSPDHGEWLEIGAEARARQTAIEDLVEREIVARGIRFPQGGLEHGLLDFPTTYQGRWVYLCWRSGEPRVVAWHETDGGFAGRRPLGPELARVMGRTGEGGLPDDSVLDL